MDNIQGHAGLTTPPQHHTTMRLLDILWGKYTPTQRATAALAVLGLVAACVLAEIIETL